MFLLVLERSAPECDLSRPLEEQSRWTEHAAFMNGLVDSGFLVIGGPLSDEFRVAHAVEAESEDAVRETLARDPWSGSHLRVSTIDRWRIRLDGRPRRTWPSPRVTCFRGCSRGTRAPWNGVRTTTSRSSERGRRGSRWDGSSPAGAFAS